MQREKIVYLRERVLFYCSGMVREQMISGDKYEDIKRVVNITIANHVAIPEDMAYHHRYTLYDPETRSEFTDLLEVHVIELPKLSPEDDGSELWWWMKFLTVNTKEELAMIAVKSPVLECAAARLIEVSEDTQTRCRLENQLIYELDQRDRMNAAKKEGREEGIEKVISLIEQGLSLDEVKVILSKKQVKEGNKP
jgi:predicted transposase/invertase (TIGR01784 family)